MVFSTWRVRVEVEICHNADYCRKAKPEPESWKPESRSPVIDKSSNRGPAIEEEVSHLTTEPAKSQ